MKTKHTLIFTLITFVTLTLVSTSFAQDASNDEYIVRVIYFIPNDREPDPRIDAKLDTLMKDAQQFYADQMEAHGFNRKTFRFEADENENAVVHHVNGKFNDAYYQNPSTGSWIVWTEIEEQFDTSKNIYFLALGISNEYIDGNDTTVGRASGNSLSGRVLVPASELGAAIHELGHAFGLLHDYRFKARRIFTSSLQDFMTTSFCAAEWLDAHRYFNANQEDFNGNTDIQLHPPSLAEPPYNIRLRFTVTDPDGLHQAQLFFPLRTNESTLAACQSLSGNNATVEFLTDQLIGVNGITLRVMDRHGNFTERFFSIDITNLLQDRDVVISIPDPNLASEVRRHLDVSPGVAITQLDMLKLKVADFTNGGQITDLAGLEYAINLRDLRLQNQGIQNITPLAKLSKLDTLDLEGNPINNITALADLTNLVNLFLDRTQINDLTPLAELTSLQSLSIDQNKIDDITPLAGLTNLWNLGASLTQINDIGPLAGLTNLEQLNLYGNQPEINDITPLAGLTNLVSLFLYDNKVDDITPLMDMTNLRWLNLGLNQVNDITPLTGLTNLESLIIDGNQVNDITPLAGLTNLSRLGIMGNPISDISPITKFTQLRALYLGGIHFTDGSYLGGIPIKDTSFLTELTELEDLVLVNCQISEISQIARLTQLQYLSLNFNQISDVRPLVNLLNLKHLYLLRNPITNRKPLLELLRKNPDVKIYLKVGGDPLPVSLSHFRAERTDAGVLVKWITESEVDNAGFYIYRSETKDSEFKIVNPQLIQGAGTTSERNEYTWTDTTAKPNTVYYYQIEDVSHAGVRKSLATVRMRGLVSASGKLTVRWADLKTQD